MERLTTDIPQNNTQFARNLFYIKNRETWVRGGEDADMSLYDFIRSIIQTHSLSIDVGDNEDLSEQLFYLLEDGTNTAEGVVGLFYTAAWAFSELREALKIYEDIGTPDQLRALKDAEEKRREGECKQLNAAGEYAVKFAENHGISISEAMEQPMVKARFTFFAETGM